jgi:hypothetical protein
MPRKHREFLFDTIGAMKYVKGLAIILLLTISQICLCLIAAFLSDSTTKPAIETVHVYPQGTTPDLLDRLLKQENIEMDSPMPNRAQWPTHLADSTGGDRPRLQN